MLLRNTPFVKFQNFQKVFFYDMSTNIIFLIVCLFSQEGDKVPSVDLFEDSPANKINISDLCANKKVALFAVPGKQKLISISDDPVMTFAI